jgi:hypothetical protein
MSSDVCVRSGNTRAVHRKNTAAPSIVFSRVKQCSLVEVRRRFRLCFRLLISSYIVSLLLDSEYWEVFSETSVKYHRTTRRHIPGDPTVHSRSCKELNPIRDMCFVRTVSSCKRNETQQGWHHWDNKKVQFIIAYPLPLTSLIAPLEIATAIWLSPLRRGRDPQYEQPPGCFLVFTMGIAWFSVRSEQLDILNLTSINLAAEILMGNFDNYRTCLLLPQVTLLLVHARTA